MNVPAYEERGFCSYASGFNCTNEQPEIHNRVLDLGGVREVSKACSIASGGEVVLFSILPRVRSLCVAVDHSRKSLAWFWLKVMVLAEKGPEETKEFFSLKQTTQALKHYADQIPQNLRQRVYEDIAYPLSSDIIREWAMAPLDALAASWQNLDKLRIIQGDIYDVVDQAPFDLLYISNIMQHQDRTGRVPDKERLRTLITDQGKILMTGTWPYDYKPVPGQLYVSGASYPPPSNLQKVADGGTHIRALSWNYSLWEPKRVEEAKAS